VAIPLTRIADGVTLRVRVIPRAGRTGVAGTREDALLVRLAAAPVDGAANDALIGYLSELFDRPRRDITIVSGHTSRDKRIAVAGTTEAAIARQLEAALRTL
jgi:uncharacterized protein (TIGR00251 family)